MNSYSFLEKRKCRECGETFQAEKYRERDCYCSLCSGRSIPPLVFNVDGKKIVI